MKNFNEALFVRSLMDRPADAKRYAQSFSPQWLKTAEYQPVLAKLFEFTTKHLEPPSVNTLRQMFIDEDSTAYDLRYKDTLDKIEKLEYDTSEVLLNLDKAKNVMVSWSLESLVKNPDFVHSLEHFEGEEVLSTVQKWITQFEGSTEDVEFSITDAVEDLIKTRGWNANTTAIPTGIEFIDEWCGGGLKPRQLGLIVAPTGQGKSMCLMNMAYHMSVLCEKRVMFISNELSMGEVTERFGALLAQEDQNTVVHEPTVIRKGLEKLTKFGVRDRLHLIEVNRDISVNDIEAMIARNVNLFGWAPEVIIIDYMERMKPVTHGLDRNIVWDWFGEIAKDLIRMSKRTNTLVWSACQTNRSGFNGQVEQSLSQAQGSVKHLQEASAVIGMRQRPDYSTDTMKQKGRKILEFATLKMRHARMDPTPVLVEADLARMIITREYHKPSEWDKVDENESGVGTSVKKNKKP